MGLDRFTNQEDIENSVGSVRGTQWKSNQTYILKLDTVNISPENVPTVEVHFYGPGSDGAYIIGGITSQFELKQNELFINYNEIANQFDLAKGQYRVTVNVYRNMLGTPDEDDVYISEISDDRRELRITTSNVNVQEYLDIIDDVSIKEPVYETSIDANGIPEIVYDSDNEPIIINYIERPLPSEYSINLRQNKIYKIINQKAWLKDNEFIIRLYEDLPSDIEENTFLHVIGELSDSYIDTIELLSTYKEPDPNQLRGPNWDVELEYGTISETNFKNWNSLLSSNTKTSQKIIDSYFSGSLSGIKLGIDYTAFDNFVFYSSAKERIDNFEYKLQQLEHYDTKLSTFNNTLESGNTDGGALSNNIAINEERRNNIIGSFDPFEKWAYYEPSGSLSTHGVSGSYIGAHGYTLTPHPKNISASFHSGEYQNKGLSDNESLAWFRGFKSTASLYDIQNPNALSKTIPEHIRTDTNNDQYELFVNMIGHHFDLIYTYANALAKTYQPEEHPKLGRSRDVLYNVAESLGWKLANGKQASQLWQYKLGTNDSGSFQTTSSLFSKSDEDITTEVWRRIVNNLPYLLKTKGTARGIKALMNTYGIPQTLLSIREYGGPKVDEDTPLLIEDKYNYAINFDHVLSTTPVLNPYITHPNFYLSASAFPGMISWATVTQSHDFSIPIITREYRFRPTEKSNMMLHVAQDEGRRSMHHVAIEYTASYSGSDKYGRIHHVVGNDGFGEEKQGASGSVTDWVPLFDGQYWNMRQFYTTTNTDTTLAEYWNAQTSSNISYHVQVQASSDYITDKIVHSTSASFTPTVTSSFTYWSKDWIDDYGTTKHVNIQIGGVVATHRAVDIGILNADSLLTSSFMGSGITSLPDTFSGSMQEYREWTEPLDQHTFDIHTTNPTSYASSISPTSSFDTLVRHYPLGTDNKAYYHWWLSAVGNVGIGIISSSHPNHIVKDFSKRAAAPADMGNSTNATASRFQINADGPGGLNGPAVYNYANIDQNASGDKIGSYVTNKETYYIQGVSLGGALPKSQKIRLESNYLRGGGRLSPNASAEVSSYDNAAIDTNRLGLFYSAADQINKEIFNHIGDVALDDFVGDPDDEFEGTYPDLTRFSNAYWKKYTDRNDLNAFQRIFSQFDFALFNQIKQLLPERVDEAMGLIVEPNALERSKYVMTHRPVKEEPMYSVTIEDPETTASGSMLPISSSIAMPYNELVVTSLHQVQEAGYSHTGQYIASISASTSQGDPYVGYDYFDKQVLPLIPIAGYLDVNMPTSYTCSFIRYTSTGSFNCHPDDINSVKSEGYYGNLLPTSVNNTASIAGLSQWSSSVDATATNDNGNNFQSASYHGRAVIDVLNDFSNETSHLKTFSAHGMGDNADGSWGSAGGDSLGGGPGHSSMAFELTLDTKQFSQFDTINDITIHVHYQLVASGLTVGASGGSAATPDNNIFKLSLEGKQEEGNEYLSRTISTKQFTTSGSGYHLTPVTGSVEFENVHMGNFDKEIALRVQCFNITGSNKFIQINGIKAIRKLKKVGHRAHGYIIDSNRPSTIFSLDKLHYSGSYTKATQNYSIFLSQSLGNGVPSIYNSSRSIDSTSYRDDEFLQVDNLRFNGSRISSPGVNIASGYAALGNKPVIEVFSLNPNQIIFTDQPTSGNPGNLIVR